MKIYLKPKAEIIALESDNVLALSGPESFGDFNYSILTSTEEIS